MTTLTLGAFLSLSGKHARFGHQAQLGLEIWHTANPALNLLIQDDHSDPAVLRAGFRDLADRCDLLLGPYSTHLTRTAAHLAADHDRLLWNHGGSGDDVEASHPGHLVSILTPTSQYATPFLHHLTTTTPLPLWIATGKGSFGRQVSDGAETTAHTLGLPTVRLGPSDDLANATTTQPWALLCAGAFEEDVETIERARALPVPPQVVCAVAAGVHEFGQALDNPQGTYGIGQWFPGTTPTPRLGMDEHTFLTAYHDRTGVLPDYPAVQAVAAATIATHCATTAGSTSRTALWQAATDLETTTLFGAFKIDPHTGTQRGHQPALIRWGPISPTPL
ncbi:ABC transporter substrate-binding protein [Streptosporangium sp. NPDC020072]|uniref:ABC transporter substrate-binding protein n=1 Tax=Streptosporangium sp. NPDC020072 TaxID=3154788 RepID=UPI00342E2CF2